MGEESALDNLRKLAADNPEAFQPEKALALAFHYFGSYDEAITRFLKAADLAAASEIKVELITGPVPFDVEKLKA